MALRNPRSTAQRPAIANGQGTGEARVVPLRLRTGPPDEAPPAAQTDAPPTQVFVEIRVPYDVAAVAHVIAPILDYDAAVLTRRLCAGPLVDGPHSHAEAAGLIETLGHFGAVCEIQRIQSLESMPAVDDPQRENPVGRYVYGTARRSKGPTRPLGLAGGKQ